MRLTPAIGIFKNSIICWMTFTPNPRKNQNRISPILNKGYFLPDFL